MTDGQDCTHGDPGIPGFWDSVRSAPAVALLLDYDGTLAPFHIDRMAAVPADGVVDALHQIDRSGRTTIAIVSGRPVHEVRELLPEPDLTIIGTHGYELRPRGGETITQTVTPIQASILDRAYALAQSNVGENRVERKSATVAAHVRGLTDAEIQDARNTIIESWSDIADPVAVEIREFNGGIEMRALGSNKGTAIDSFIRGLPGPTLAVYLGDDETDEDAFRTVNRLNGFSIRVGDPEQVTAAAGRLRGASDVVQFLECWVSVRGKP